MSLSQSSIIARAYRNPWSRYMGILAYIGLVVCVLFVFFANWAYDDPFITYRYARNLVNGIGFVYNPGERVLSTTTPLYVLVLAALSPLPLDLPQLSILLGAFCLACGGLLIWSLALPGETMAAGWVGLVLYPSFPLLIATLGSEVPFYLMLCLAGLASYARRRYSLAAICVALATLARPDGALLALLLAVHYLIYVRKPFPWAALAWFAAITIPWLVFAWLYFGSPIPVTLAAKQYQGSMVISQRFAAGLQTTLAPFLRRPYFWLEAVLAIVGLVFSFWFGRCYWLMWIWAAFYFAGYSLLGVSRYFWYYAPLVPGFVAAVGVGVAGLRAQVMALRRPFSQAGNLLAGLIILLLFLGQAQSLQQQAITMDLRYPVYRAAGEWLAENTPPGSSVGALEIGIIGYYADRPAVDFAGLVQPDVAPQLQGSDSYEEAAEWAVQRYRPNYLVLHDKMFPALESNYVTEHCHMVHNFPATEGQYPRSIRIVACDQADG